MKTLEEEFRERFVTEKAFSTVIPAQGVLCGDYKEILAFMQAREKAQREEFKKMVITVHRKYVLEKPDRDLSTCSEDEIAHYQLGVDDLAHTILSQIDKQ